MLTIDTIDVLRVALGDDLLNAFRAMHGRR